MRRNLILFFLCVFAVSAVAADLPRTDHSAALNQAIEKIAAREGEFTNNLRSFSPIVETYIQVMSPDKELGAVPRADHYYLGRMSFRKEMADHSFDETGDRTGFIERIFRPVSKLNPISNKSRFIATGFAQMAVIDADGLSQQHYSFKLIRREFLGEVRCLVFDISPKPKTGRGRFLGRIWVEDQNYNIVRYNGIFVPSHNRYLHFDSWRINMAPGVWLPAYIYTEESEVKLGAFAHAAIKAQTRLWGYKQADTDSESTFTDVVVDPADEVRDQSAPHTSLSPLASERAWELEAENNVIDRLTQAGVLAPSGDVDKILSTVVNNLEITNNLTVEPEVRCRVLLTAPLESFTVGHTIVISRGLLDVLPDEASLAAVLAHELAHIVLGHQLDTKFAFSDRLFFSDIVTFSRLQMTHSAEDDAAADKKSAELLDHSPYKDKLASIGLFLRQFEASRTSLPNLCKAHIGSTLLMDRRNVRLAGIMQSAPTLEPARVEQIAALPLGGRVQIDSWTNAAQLAKNPALAVLSAREKMALEVTPMYPYLTRITSTKKSAAALPTQKESE
jgi:hypothetical protein